MKRLVALFSAFLLTLVLFSGCGPGCGDSCDGDGECDGSQICFSGQCAPEECADCPGSIIKICRFVALDCRFVGCD